MLASTQMKGGKETTSLDEAMEAIAAQGREHGFVTSSDLLQGLPAEDLGSDQVEAFLMDVQDYLRHEGIDVLEIRREASEDEVGKPRGIRRGRDDVFANDPVRLYLNEIAEVRPLTAAQEVSGKRGRCALASSRSGRTRTDTRGGPSTRRSGRHGTGTSRAPS
jgi:Sigma-70 factor, region 1.1/Sigma-70 factor, region 1.2